MFAGSFIFIFRHTSSPPRTKLSSDSCQLSVQDTSAQLPERRAELRRRQSGQVAARVAGCVCILAVMRIAVHQQVVV